MNRSPIEALRNRFSAAERKKRHMQTVPQHANNFRKLAVERLEELLPLSTATGQDAPTAYWALEQPGDTVVDAGEGEHDGVNVGGVFSDDKPENLLGSTGSMRFDGAGEHMNLGALRLAERDVTYSMWVNPDVVDDRYQGILTQRRLNNSSFSMSIFDGGQIYVEMNNGAERNAFSAGIVPTGEWTHVTGMYDSTKEEIRIYFNGVLDTTVGGIGNGNLVYSGEPMIAGGLYDGRGGVAWNYKGKLDDVKLFDHVLTEEEIQSSMVNAGVTVEQETEAVAEAVDEVMEDEDVSGVVPGNLLGDLGGMHFDGTGEHVNLGNPQLAERDVTVSAWVNPEYINRGPQGILTQRRINNSSFSVNLLNGGQIYVEMNNGVERNAFSAGRVPAEEWTHVTAMYDSEKQEIRVYIGGILDTVVSGVGDGNLLYSGEHLMAGGLDDGKGGTAWNYAGGIDDLGLWNRVLTNEEVVLAGSGVPGIDANESVELAQFTPTLKVAGIQGPNIIFTVESPEDTSFVTIEGQGLLSGTNLEHPGGTRLASGDVTFRNSNHPGTYHLQLLDRQDGNVLKKIPLIWNGNTLSVDVVYRWSAEDTIESYLTHGLQNIRQLADDITKAEAAVQLFGERMGLDLSAITSGEIQTIQGKQLYEDSPFVLSIEEMHAMIYSAFPKWQNGPNWDAYVDETWEAGGRTSQRGQVEDCLYKERQAYFQARTEELWRYENTLSSLLFDYMKIMEKVQQGESEPLLLEQINDRVAPRPQELNTQIPGFTPPTRGEIMQAAVGLFETHTEELIGKMAAQERVDRREQLRLDDPLVGGDGTVEVSEYVAQMDSEGNRRLARAGRLVEYAMAEANDPHVIAIIAARDDTNLQRDRFIAQQERFLAMSNAAKEVVGEDGVQEAMDKGVITSVSEEFAMLGDWARVMAQDEELRFGAELEKALEEFGTQITTNDKEQSSDILRTNELPEGIWLIGHKIGPSDKFHFAILMKSKDVKDIDNWNTGDGNADIPWMTLGAGSSRDLFFNLGLLESDYNRSTDNPELETNTLIAGIALSDGITLKQSIQSLINADSKYNDNAPYDALVYGGEFNSNSYVAGILQAAGLYQPIISQDTEAPGYYKPLPIPYQY